MTTELEDVDAPERELSDDTPPVYRGATSDPTFGYLIACAVALGLTTLPAGNADFRYTVSWLVMAGFGVVAWLFGDSERIGQERLENLAWGIAFGLIIGAPLLAFGSEVLSSAARLMFPQMRLGTVLAYVVFVMPLAETLFFRGVLQQHREWWVVGLQSSLWSVILLFPTMWTEVVRSPAVAVIMGTALVMVNLIYSYVRQRNGLAAAWMCQIVANIVLVFLPSL